MKSIKKITMLMALSKLKNIGLNAWKFSKSLEFIHIEIAGFEIQHGRNFRALYAVVKF